MKAAFIAVYFLQHWQNTFHGIIVTSEEEMLLVLRPANIVENS